MRKRQGVREDKPPTSQLFLEFTLNLLDTLMLERPAYNSCKVLKLIKISELMVVFSYNRDTSS